MSEEEETYRPGGILRLIDDIQAAAAAPLSALPEIAESETLRKAADRLQQSQKDLYRTLKDAYPTAVLNQAERERLTDAVTAASKKAEIAADAAHVAREELRETVEAATDFGLSDQYVGRLAGVSKQTVRDWRNSPRPKPSGKSPREATNPDDSNDGG